MINIIWVVLIVGSILYALAMGNIGNVMDQILVSGNDTVKLLLKLAPIICIWLGIMKIAEISGLLKKVAFYLSPFFAKLFPSIPKDDESLSLIASSVILDAVGMGSASTPIGLKTMEKLDELNDYSTKASDAMITFMLINSCGFTIIPTTVIALRTMHGSTDPTAIIIPTIIASLSALTIALFLDYLFRRRRRRVR